jgi:hypothetical protein
MDELIRKQTILNMIDNVQFGNITHKLSQLHEAVRNLPSSQQWIPCAERLPNEDGKYLVTGKHGAVNIINYENGRWYGGQKPIAWMPLTEPYREETES